MTTDARRLSLDEKLELIQGRARRLGFRRHDLEDAVQEVAIAVLEFTFDPARSNGATETTALITVIDRRLKSLLRSERRYAGLLARAAGHLSVACDGLDDGPCCEEDAVDSILIEDAVAEIVDQMDAEMQQVCQLLMDGKSTTAIADELGYGWHRVNRIVSAIRQRFESAGLNPTAFE